MTRVLPREPDDPHTAGELRAELDRVHRESLAYWASYDDAAFFQPMGEHWSAADHVRHLTRSLRAAIPGYRLPRLALRVMFGRPRGPSRRYAALREDYHAVLAAGGRAGRFAPAPLAAGDRTAAERARVMERHAAAVKALGGALIRWKESSLDRACLPHPLLGPLTLREMGEFMVYHDFHHVQVAERRRLEMRG